MAAVLVEAVEIVGSPDTPARPPSQWFKANAGWMARSGAGCAGSGHRAAVTC